jgi:hypothetical protein
LGGGVGTEPDWFMMWIFFNKKEEREREKS